MTKGVFSGHRIGWIAALLVLLGVVLWNAYLEVFELGPGSVGTEARSDTPVADSILDMGSLERFTIIGTQKETPRVKVDGRHYTIVTLDSGERVLLRLRDGSDYPHPSDSGNLLYPIGAWVPLEVNDQTRMALAGQVPPLASTTYYIDMEGNTGSALSPQGFAAAYISLCLVIAVFAAVSYQTRRIDRHAEAVLAGQNASLPRDDKERWLLGTYAIWAQLQSAESQTDGSEPAWDAENLYIGGLPSDAENRLRTLENLRKSWDITTRESLTKTVDHMTTGEGFQRCQTQADRAWQLCRAEQLVGMAYAVGWYSREELRHRGGKIGQLIQKTFPSWEDLCESFLEAYAQWQLRSYPQSASQNIHRYRQIYEFLWTTPSSPYRLPWRLPL